ncbi:lysyl oxidase-like 5b [Thalassophryne amazonica]|uniref:lysyl oxidase-like 5b n=1 Tax=Thalassophryne amazonica TaxID=390379 RepID=UPI0014724197|nr:lysyl oxidase-like 5b [Thalassophryne amazonica]
MAKWSLTFLFFIQGLLPLVAGQQQHQRAGLWRHRIQWENRGQVYSLMSTGSEYQAPVRRGQTSVYVSRGGGTSNQTPGEQRETMYLTIRQAEPRESSSNQTNHSVEPESNAREDGQQRGRASGARQQPVRISQTGPPGYPSAKRHNSQNIHSISDGSQDAGGHRGREPEYHLLRTVSQAERSLPGYAITHESESEAAAEGMVNDDPRNPFKSHRNSVFYNMYPTRRRSVAQTHRQPGTGYGTRFFLNGLPDLVPDSYAIQAGVYIQRVQMYALRCAAEENCLARSAYGPRVRDIDFRVLLRFPQKVKNQGNADFLPLKPRHQWEWHSCHQHFHSMDAFSNYDLLDITTGRKVAKGHKASFCLEDTSCEPGFRRRYACTSHTQGLSPGCNDIYAANIDCQWIDITDVPPGNYILKVTVNPNFLVMESDFTNNVVRCEVTYTGAYVQTHHCGITRG